MLCLAFVLNVAVICYVIKYLNDDFARYCQLLTNISLSVLRKCRVSVKSVDQLKICKTKYWNRFFFCCCL